MGCCEYYGMCFGCCFILNLLKVNQNYWNLFCVECIAITMLVIRLVTNCFWDYYVDITSMSD